MENSHESSGRVRNQKAQGASTWRGLILLATSAGLAISEEMSGQIVAFGLGLAGLVGALFSDSPTVDQKTEQ